MKRTATLERRADATDSLLDSNIEREVEAVLEAAEQVVDTRSDSFGGKTGTGHWRFRMPQAGVRYYSF